MLIQLVYLLYKCLILHDNIEICCSFKSFAGGTCGFSYREDRSCISQVVPLCSCQKDISSHLRSCKFSVILSGAGIFETPIDIDDFTICPTQIKSRCWVSRDSNSRGRVSEEECGRNKGRVKSIPKAYRGIGKRVSQMVLMVFLRIYSCNCTDVRETRSLIKLGNGAQFHLTSKSKRTITLQKMRGFHKMFANIKSSGKLELQAQQSLKRLWLSIVVNNDRS